MLRYLGAEPKSCCCVWEFGTSSDSALTSIDRSFVCICLKACPFVLQGNLSFSCVEPYTVPVFFNATSYLEVPGRPNQDLFSVSFQFRTWNPNGLLLFSQFADNLGNVEIDLTESKVGVHINVTQTKMSQIDISSGECNPFETAIVISTASNAFVLLVLRACGYVWIQTWWDFYLAAQSTDWVREHWKFAQRARGGWGGKLVETVSEHQDLLLLIPACSR